MSEGSDEWVCPNCRSSEFAVPVWSLPADFKAGKPPKFIGCMNCNEMTKV